MIDLVARGAFSFFEDTEDREQDDLLFVSDASGLELEGSDLKLDEFTILGVRLLESRLLESWLGCASLCNDFDAVALIGLYS